jgi:hypothetical protein
MLKTAIERNLEIFLLILEHLGPLVTLLNDSYT